MKVTAEGLKRSGLKRSDAENIVRLQKLIHWQKAPIDYMVERLGFAREDIVWSLRKEYKKQTWDGTKDPLAVALKELAAGNWVGIESATGTGKTYLAACIVLWFLECFPGSLVITTAPREKSLEIGVWREIGKLHSRFGMGELQTLTLKMNPPGDDWIAVGMTAGVRAGEDSATKMHGAHAKHMLWVLEETPGIPPAIITAVLNTSQAEHNLVLGIGNPDHQLDSLHILCGYSGVKAIRISALDHPNVVLEKEVIPGAVTKKGLDRMLSRYHNADHPMYRSRARGICPSQGPESVIRLEWLYKAVEKWETYLGPEATKSLENQPVTIGQDVANSEDGDKAAIAIGRGDICEKVESEPCPNATQLGHRLAIMIQEKGIDPNRVAVDGTGVGAATVNALKEHEITIGETCNGAVLERYGEVEQYRSLRSQMWWQLRNDLEAGLIGLPRDEELFADLVTPRYEVRLQKICVEEKKEIKKRLSRSPDKGDAVVYWNWIRVRRSTVGGVRDPHPEDPAINPLEYYSPGKRRSVYDED